VRAIPEATLTDEVTNQNPAGPGLVRGGAIESSQESPGWALLTVDGTDEA
jgi:hypothetical protein